MTTKKATRKTTGKPASPAKNSRKGPPRPTKPASPKGAKKAPKAPAVAADAAVANTGDTAAPVRRPPREPRLSAVKAAVTVLADAPPEGMSAKQMVEAMAEAKLWTSPGGKTPEASLYASIIREIERKGDDARFRKVGRGRFVLR